MTNHNPDADTAFAVPAQSSAGDAASSGSSPSNVSGNAGGTTKQLTFNKTSYQVKSDGETLIVQVRPAGTALPDSTMQPGFTGILYDAAIGDLDNDRQPEVYAFTRSQGDNHYGSVFGVAMHGAHGVRITFPDVAPSAKGYAGQDTFYIDSLHHLLVRQFPVIDSASQRATPVMRTMKYKLDHTGEKYILTPVKP